MRPASFTPALLLIAIVALCTAVSFFVIVAGTRGMPWFGLDLAVSAEGRAIVIARTQATLGAGEPIAGSQVLAGSQVVAGSQVLSGSQVLAGHQVRAIGLPGQTPVPLTVTDLVPEPDSLTSYADLRAFFARQSALHAVLSAADPWIEVHLLAPPTQTPRTIRVAVAPRPFLALPSGFWVQLLTGVGAVLIAGWVWALRAQRLGPSLFLLSALGMAASTSTSAIYANRALALDGALFSFLQQINSLGAITFALAMIGLLLTYPVRLVPPRWLWLLVPIELGISLLIFGRIGSGPDQLYIFIALATLAILAIIGGQWWQTRRNPAERAALTWLGISIALGCLAYTLFGALPVLFNLPLALPQTHVTGVLIVIYIGLALGLSRYRLFELGDWAYRIFFYMAGAILLVLVDMALIALLNVDSAPALGLSLVLVAFIYLPLRDIVWRRLTRRRTMPQHEVFAAALDIAFAPSPAQGAQRWRALLTRLFDALDIAATAPVAGAQLHTDGLGLDLPAVAGSPPLRLTYPYGGRGLFSPFDVKLADTLLTLTEKAEESRQAYMRGVGEERQRMARDLHDDVGARLLTGLHTADERTRQTLQAALSDIRTIVAGLIGEEAELDLVLAQIRHEAARRLEAAGIALVWPLSATATAIRLDYRVHKALSSAMREIVSNTIRHARASRFSVTLTQADTRLRARIEDNGAGLPDTALAEQSEGFGLSNLRQRLADIGGTIAFTNEDGATILLDIPLQPHPQPDDPAPEPGVHLPMPEVNSMQ